MKMVEVLKDEMNNSLKKSMKTHTKKWTEINKTVQDPKVEGKINEETEENLEMKKFRYLSRKPNQENAGDRGKNLRQ